MRIGSSVRSRAQRQEAVRRQICFPLKGERGMRFTYIRTLEAEALRSLLGLDYFEVTQDCAIGVRAQQDLAQGARTTWDAHISASVDERNGDGRLRPTESDGRHLTTTTSDA